jgi:Fic family protein
LFQAVEGSGETVAAKEGAIDLVLADRLYRPFPPFAHWCGLAPEDAVLWDRFARVRAASRELATEEALARATVIATRAAAIETGAIEELYSTYRELTMRIATRAAGWERELVERGAHVRDLFAAQLAAYELALDAATRQLPISEAWIRALHATVCAAQPTYRALTGQGWQDQELAKGAYKRRPNHVSLSSGGALAFAPVDRVPEEMHRLVLEMRSEIFEQAHPVLQASYAHFALVKIHPFTDGNGRVARSLGSYFFYRALSLPLLIFVDAKPSYLAALEAADDGDCQPLVSFFRDRGIDAVRWVGDALRLASSPLR